MTDRCTVVIFALAQKVRQKTPLLTFETGYWFHKFWQCKRNRTVKGEFTVFVSHWAHQYFKGREELFHQLWKQIAQLIAWPAVKWFTQFFFLCLGTEIESRIYQQGKLTIFILSQAAAPKQKTGKAVPAAALSLLLPSPVISVVSSANRHLSHFQLKYI